MITSRPATRTRAQPKANDAPIPASSQLNAVLGEAAKTIGACADGPADSMSLGTRGGCSRGPCIARAGEGTATAAPMAAMTRGLRSMAASSSPRTWGELTPLSALAQSRRLTARPPAADPLEQPVQDHAPTLLLGASLS